MLFANDADGYRGEWWHDDVYGDDDAPYGEPQDIQIHELIDSAVALTHWTGPNGNRLEETSLSVAVGEVCASTPTDVLKPSDSQYEGYMGNWGNTLDRWYHRAAVVIWPRALAFANRAEPSPVWALDQLTAMASTGDVAGALAAARTLTPFWDATVHSRLSADQGEVSELFETVLQAGHAVADEASAMMLLRPFRVENLTDAAVTSFAEITSAYGQRWAMELLGTWFDEARPVWPYGGWSDPVGWRNGCQACARGLHAAGDAGTVAAQHLLDLAWQWTEKAIRSALGGSLPSQRDQQLTALGEPLAALLSAAAAIGAASTVDTISHYVRKQDDAVAALEMSALRAAAALSSGKRAPRTNAGFRVLADDCMPRLRSRLDRPFRAHDDWSIELSADGCTCELCVVLRGFLANPSRLTFEWPLAEQRRRHVHSRIDGAELPVTHVTRRRGRPYTLVLTKTDALFTGDLRSRASAAADLEWLAAKWTSSVKRGSDS